MVLAITDDYDWWGRILLCSIIRTHTEDLHDHNSLSKLCSVKGINCFCNWIRQKETKRKLSWIKQLWNEGGCLDHQLNSGAISLLLPQGRNIRETFLLDRLTVVWFALNSSKTECIIGENEVMPLRSKEMSKPKWFRLGRPRNGYCADRRHVGSIKERSWMVLSWDEWMVLDRCHCTWTPN